MSTLDTLFYMCAVGTLACAVGALTVPNVFYGVLCLIGAFFNSAGLFLLLEAEFLAFVLIVVYVGAVALLFLFIIMALPRKDAKVSMILTNKKPALFLSGVLLLEILVFLFTRFQGVEVPFMGASMPMSNTHAIGSVLYTKYFFHFQMVGLILLISMVGSIVLIWQKEETGKSQKMGKQSAVRASDRVSLKKVPVKKGVSL